MATEELNEDFLDLLRCFVEGGVEFDDAWPDRALVDIQGLAVPVLDRQHLIANKRASGRTKDLADLEALDAQGDEA